MDNLQSTRQSAAQERVKWIDRQNSEVTSAFFSVDRQYMAHQISKELLRLYDTTHDPRKFKRDHRKIRTALCVLGTILSDLMTKPDLDKQFVREALAELGVQVEVVNFNERTVH